VDLQQDSLEAVLPSLDLDFVQLASAHIHLGHRPLLNLTDRLVVGQCIKVIEDHTDLEQQERRAYVGFQIPGFPKEKIADTTFVVLDMLGITIESFLKIHGLLGDEARPRQVKNSEPDMSDLEQVICHEASRVLMHELLHVPKPLLAGVSYEEHDQHRESEETFVDRKLAEIGDGGVPPRLVDVRLLRRFDMPTMAITLQAIQNHRIAPASE
jgi:hypothetical protein